MDEQRRWLASMVNEEEALKPIPASRLLTRINVLHGSIDPQHGLTGFDAEFCVRLSSPSKALLLTRLPSSLLRSGRRKTKQLEITHPL